MTAILSKLQDAFQRQGTNVPNSLKLVPAAFKEIAKIKANGNQIGFVKEGRQWYADLKNWPLNRAHLLMVAGADDLLDELANGEEYVTLKISQHSKPVETEENETLLGLLYKDDNGFSGTYKVNGDYTTEQVWLCPVVNFVFLKVPKYILFSKVG